ncbi:VOC family protein, partial [Paracoccus sanguinis]|uniref:VOC family protein n=1 Tax=Paracoccus sanguinis TaxID=1545044 RepID=UPI0018CD96AD
MPLRVRALDHLVLTVTDIEATVAFYEALGMTRVRFGEGRVALAFGGQKINLHQAGAEIAPHAAHPRHGRQDHPDLGPPVAHAHQRLVEAPAE